MKNYSHIIDLGNNKYAYNQLPQFRRSGNDVVSKVLGRWSPPKTYYHLRNGGHVAAAVRHSQNCFFSRFDVSRFFYRVTKNKLINALKSIGIPFQDALMVAQESVVRTDDGFSLPYGFVQSPVLASLALDRSKAGEFLRKIPREFTLSVYVDDIVISHQSDRSSLDALSRRLIEIFASSGFPVSKDKCTIAQATVEAFNIEISNGSLAITQKRMDEFKGDLMMANGNDHVIRGIHGYVASVNISQARALGYRG